MKKCPLQPCGDIVVLKPDRPVRQIGRIQLAYERASQRGTVVAVGPDNEDVADGDIVLYRIWLTEVEVDDETWLLVRGDDVLARV